MSDCQEFPNTWEEFEQLYGFEDKKEIYTNGSRLIQSFRVKQWLESKCVGIHGLDIEKLDALHYLKEYQTLQTAYIKAMADLEDNPPLTWEELKQMEGKPVWVESQRFGNHWYLNRGIKDESCFYFVGHYGENVLLYSDDLGKIWQAYRKERS